MNKLRSILFVSFWYFIFACLALQIAIPPGYSSPIWPASGIALGFVLVRGYSVAIGVFIASFLANIFTSIDVISANMLMSSVTLSVGIACGATLQAIISAFLVRLFIRNDIELTRPENIAQFFLLGGLVGCLVSPAIGTWILKWHDIIPDNGIWINGIIWWAGDLLGVFLFGPLTLVWLLRKQKIWRSRIVVLSIPLLISSLCIFGLFYLWDGEHKANLRVVLNDRAHRFENIIQQELSEAYVALGYLQHFYLSSTFVDREEFRQFSKHAVDTFSIIQSFAWVPRILQDEKEQYVQQAIKDGVVDFEFKRLTSGGQIKKDFEDREAYYPIFYIEPFMKNREAIGINNASESRRWDVLSLTRDTGVLDASDIIELVQGKSSRIKSILLSAPIYSEGGLTTIEGRRKNLKGFVTATVDVDKLFEKALKKEDLKYISLNVSEIDTNNKKLIFNRSANDFATDKIDSILINAKVGYSRTWKFIFTPTASFYNAGNTWTLWFLIISILVLTGLLNILFLIITGQTIESSKLVEERTNALNIANEELEKQIKQQEQITINLENQALKMNQQQIATLNILEDVEEEKNRADYERQQAEIAEEQIKLIIENSPYGIIMVSKDGSIVMVNKKVEEYFKYQRGELISQKVEILVPEQARHKHIDHRKEYNKHASARPMLGRELLARCKDGSVFPVEILLNPIIIKGEEFVLATVIDITERKEAERKVKEAANIKAEFASIVSHELRTPLTAIKESINMVFQGVFGELNEKQKQFLSLSKRNVDRLGDLINDVLDYQKLTDGKMRIYLEKDDMNETIRETAEIMGPHAKQKNILIKLELEEQLPKAMFDRNKIIQVLTNLINNAIKFTEQGVVIIRSYSEGNNLVHVEVKDTGMGIKEEDLSRLFKSFEQFGGNDRKVGGTGLGLAICQQLILAQSGKIWAESKFGEGSIFHFVLPIEERRKS